MADDIVKSGAGQQFRSFFQRLTTGQKLMIGGVAAVTLVGLVLMFSAVGSKPMSVLYSDLAAQDAAAIVDRLKEGQIEYELEQNGTAILVPEEILHQTRLQLAGEGLPKTSVVGYEIFDETNLGMSDFVQKLNYKRALEGELARTIMTLEEVSRARIHIVIPERALFERDQQQPTASVVLHVDNGRSVSRMNVEGIQNMVASSVEGMDPVNVKVMDQKARLLSPEARDNNSLAGLSSTQYEQKQKVDSYLAAKVQSLLNQVLGVDRTVVRVDAELDFTQVERTVEDYDPDRQVVRSEQVISEFSNTQDSLNYPEVNSEAQRGNTITNYEISKSVERIVGGVGEIERLTVAVLVDGTYEKVENADGVQELQYSPRSEGELDQLREIVRSAVGYDPARNDQVSLVNISFNSELPEIDPVTGPTGIKLVDQWYREITIFIVMVLAIFMLWRIISAPQIRERLERVLAPSDLERQRVELAQAAADRQRKLLETLTESSEQLALPGSLDEHGQLQLPDGELTADAEFKREMRERVFEFLKENPEPGAKLLQTMMRQDIFDRN